MKHKPLTRADLDDFVAGIVENLRDALAQFDAVADALEEA